MKKDTTLKIRLTSGELIAFARLAGYLEKSMSEILREAIYELLKNMGQNDQSTQTKPRMEELTNEH